jgi:transcription elongation GreA/GreB family factor
MTEETRNKFKELLRKKDADGLESLWLELGEKPETFFELDDLLAKSDLREKSATLLSVLLANLKERSDFPGALQVLKRLAQLTPNERYLRREIGVCLFQAYPNNLRLETFVSKSELTDDRPILEALEFIEHCLAFDAGNYAYDSEMGMGKVLDLDLMVDKLSVNFGKDKPVTYHLGAAFKHLTAVSQEHFLIRKQKDADDLRAMATQNPLELLKNLLKSFDRPLKPREIKTYLEGIVSENDWEGFWNKVRKLAATEPNIRALTKPERSFQWLAQGEGHKPEATSRQPTADSRQPTASGDQPPATSEKPQAEKHKPQATSRKPEEESQEPQATSDKPQVRPEPSRLLRFARTGKGVGATSDKQEAPGDKPQVTGDRPPANSVKPPAPDPKPAGRREAETPGTASHFRGGNGDSPEFPVKPKPSQPRTSDEFLVALKLDGTPDYWKGMLTDAHAALKDDWPELYRQAFLETTDKRIWSVIMKELAGAASGQVNELARQVLTYYKRYPAQFLYLYRGAAKYGIPTERKGLFSRLLDLLDSDKHKSFWSEIKGWLAEANDQLLRETFKELSPEDMQRMWSRVEQLKALEDYRKDEIRKLVHAAHPAVAAEQESEREVLLSTQEGIDRKEVELRQLRDVEIPKSSEDIGRARAFGDLSENYEYKAAKEKQARLLGRLAQLSRDMAIARPIDFARVDTTQVSTGTRVKVEETPGGDVQEFTILGPWDIDPDQGIISYQAPFAQRLIGKRVGDFVPANPNMPSGKGHRILEIVRAS